MISGIPYRKPVSALALCLLFAIAGCKSASDYRVEADKVSAEYLSAVQKEVRGKEEAISIETPSETLRRRLLIDQHLAHFDPASLGIRDLPTNLYWKTDERMLPGNGGEVKSFWNGGTNVLEIGLLDAVRIAAYNSREYQSNKESLYQTALALDLEDNAFRSIFESAIKGTASTWRDGQDGRTGGHNDSGSLGVSKKFANGARLSSSLLVNIAGMLTGNRRTAWGSSADVSVSIPLLRGSGRLVNLESLTQAERSLVYAVRNFEQQKRTFVVSIEKSYLALILAKRRRQNEDDNYKRVILSTRRSRRMADASRISRSDFDQSHQSELSARASWISSCQSYESTLDSFKTTLGLPPDARIEPRDSDLQDLQTYMEKLAKSELGEYNMGEKGKPLVLEAPESVDAGDMKRMTDRAIEVAFENRLDFHTNRDKIEDAQRKLLIAEDNLRTELTIAGSASAFDQAAYATARMGDDYLKPEPKNYNGNGAFTLDLPLERTSERNAYRNALISLENAVRSYQSAEDELKSTIREDMRSLSQTREQLKIQFVAVQLAERRVRNQDLLLQAGRADMTVVLDSQAALVSAQNSLYSAMTSYRGSELSLQKDLGLLNVEVNGVWSESPLGKYGLGEIANAGKGE